MTPDGVERLIERVTAALPTSEDRPGQKAMAAAVARAIDTGTHVVVQAGTGTGKSLGYLVPAVASGKRVVVATATKALQDQLATKDLPFLDAQLADGVDWAVLKGRSNYICLQRVREVAAASQQGQLELEAAAPAVRQQVKRLAEWAGTTRTGDMSELDWAPLDAAWAAVSVGADECPGATRCPLGDACFAEGARRRAAAANVVVVNIHLYGLHVASGGVLLPDHDVVVIDEAHQLEDVMSDTVGVSISPARVARAVATVRRALDDADLLGALADTGTRLRGVLAPRAGERLPNPLPDDLLDVLRAARQRVDEVLAALRRIDTAVEDAKQRVLRAQTTAIRLAEHLDLSFSFADTYVPFVAGSADSPRLEIAPLDVGPVLAEQAWAGRSAVLTSATIPGALTHRVGLPDDTTVLDVGSPFDYEHHALLYCAMHLPDPRDAGYAAAMHDELTALITAAGGRTLALFTSYRAMEAAAAAVAERVPFTVLNQRDLPKPALLRAFGDDETACLFATSGFFQGVDLPGNTLTLVTIDRIPFPRPDDPLLSARRERLGPAAFAEIDLPRAGTLLAQAAGRLIRTSTDRGVVAVFDKRLGTARYRWELVRDLPPMRRTRHRAEAEALLRDIAERTAPPGVGSGT
jgi:ATP-dependent DNA helicase DinG